VFACVEWQVILCDPTWQVTPRGSVTGFPINNLSIYHGPWLRSDASILTEQYTITVFLATLHRTKTEVAQENGHARFVLSNVRNSERKFYWFGFSK